MPRSRGGRAFWGQPYFQYGVPRHAAATFTRAVVSAVLPQPIPPNPKGTRPIPPRAGILYFKIKPETEQNSLRSCSLSRRSAFTLSLEGLRPCLRKITNR